VFFSQPHPSNAERAVPHSGGELTSRQREDSMTRKLGALTALCLLIFSTPTFAEEPDYPSQSIVPQAGFFVGLGGSYNSVKVDQDIGGNATSQVFDGSTLAAFGKAGGPAASFHDTDSNLAPDGQLGYFNRFNDSLWLWGAKFSYKYLGTDLATNRDILPQSGSFTTKAPVLDLVPGTTTNFKGNVVIGSSQTSIDQQMAFMPFIGRSFKNSYVYFGAGPALFDTHSRISNAIGFADINGQHLDLTGAPFSFSSSEWVWGGAAQVGMNYFLSPTWYLDMNYTFAMSASFDANYSARFSNVNNGLTTTGLAKLDSSERVTS
jgi:hypothetical protein